ncbi:MAG: hypothetical protein AAGK04_10500 [Planctomycetota bacterium]
MLMEAPRDAEVRHAVTGSRQEAATMPTPGRDPRTAPLCAQAFTRLSREQILERILEINPGATTDFLADFDHTTLADYLDRLIRLRDQRGSGSRWVRRSGPPAVASRAWRHAPER